MNINETFLMTEAEGVAWHEYKSTLGPLYPGYENFDAYMNWLRDRLVEYGCIDVREHHWTHETYRVNDWPDHESGALGLISDGTPVPVGTFLMLSASTGKDGITAPMVFYDASLGEPEDGAFAGKIAVIPCGGHPEKPFSEQYLQTFVVTDTNYRSDPPLPIPMFEIPDPTINNSWNTRWDMGQWRQAMNYAMKGGALGLIVLSNLTYGCVRGLYDRQPRHDLPCIVVDREVGKKVCVDAKAGKTATLTLISEYYLCDAWNFVCLLPGVNYGTVQDEIIAINCHTDAMSLTQDNGSLGALGIARYFSHIPQEQRKKTLLFCIDSRHFIEGYEHGNAAHDPYTVNPDLREKVTVTVGLEHMGEMEGAEDYEHNTMVPTGLPELTFMMAHDNDYCARILIHSAIESGLERADIKINGRPGIHGQYKGLVRAVEAVCYGLGKCEIGQAGNWPGAHTQTFSTMQYFGSKKFRDEVHCWTLVVADLMETDSLVYDIVWHRLNSAIRKLAAENKISQDAKEGLLGLVSSIFRHVEDGEYTVASMRILNELLPALEAVASETGKDAITAANAALDRVNQNLFELVGKVIW